MQFISIMIFRVFMVVVWCFVGISLQWSLCWPAEVYMYITLLELIPIVHRKSSTNKRIMLLLRMLVLQAFMFNVQIRAQNIQGITMKSWFQWFRFRQLAPWTDCHPFRFGKLYRNWKQSSSGQCISKYSYIVIRTAKVFFFDLSYR